MTQTKAILFQEIETTINTLNIHSISTERKKTLYPLIEFIQQKKNNNQAININFICIHNSRRSHLSQVWAQVMAYHFNVQNTYCYSGGTEATAVFPLVAKTLASQGLKIQTLSEGNNPIYGIKYAENEHPIIGFSKTYESVFNPKSEFAAIMTCSQADGACPFIAGATKRIPITFEDPKAFDNTPQQEEKYIERSTQIATEMFYVFSLIK